MPYNADSPPVDLKILGQEVSNIHVNRTGHYVYNHSVTVQNIGTSPTGDFYLRVDVVGRGSDNSPARLYRMERTTNLAAGVSTILTIDVEIACNNGVFYTGQATVNPIDTYRMLETNYNNNVGEFEFQCSVST